MEGKGDEETWPGMMNDVGRKAAGYGVTFDVDTVAAARRRALADAADVSDNSDEEFDLAVHDHKAADAITGRARYISACVEQGMTPVSNFLDKIALETIDVRFHGVEPAMVEAMCYSLEVNEFVQELRLGGNKVSDKGAVALGRMLCDNTTLQALDLSNAKLSFKGAEAIFQSLVTDNHSLKVLELQQNRLATPKPMEARFAQRLGDLLEINPSLESIDLSQCELGSASIGAIANALLVTTSLKSLDLSWNTISGDSAALLVAHLNEAHLLSLNLAYSGLSDKIGVDLAAALGGQRSIKSLDISNNRLGAATAAAMSDCLTSNETLVVLRMGFNPIGYEGTSQIIAALEGNSTISVLGLENTLTCADMQPKDPEAEAAKVARANALAKAALDAPEKGGKAKGKGKGKGGAKKGKGTGATDDGAPNIPPPKPPKHMPKPNVGWCYDQVERVMDKRSKLAKVVLEFPELDRDVPKTLDVRKALGVARRAMGGAGDD